MTTKPAYFKATNGTITAFRATRTRAYRSAIVTDREISFRTAPAGPGTYPAVEITKAEYDALAKIKAERIAARHANGTLPKWISGTSPQDSWVYNESVS